MILIRLLIRFLIRLFDHIIDNIFDKRFENIFDKTFDNIFDKISDKSFDKILIRFLIRLLIRFLIGEEEEEEEKEEQTKKQNLHQGVRKKHVKHNFKNHVAYWSRGQHESVSLDVLIMFVLFFILQALPHLGIAARVAIMQLPEAEQPTWMCETRCAAPDCHHVEGLGQCYCCAAFCCVDHALLVGRPQRGERQQRLGSGCIRCYDPDSCNLRVKALQLTNFK